MTMKGLSRRTATKIAVDAAEHHAEHRRQRQHRVGMDAGLGQQQRADDGRKPGRRADRQVDAADQQHQRLPERDEADEGRLPRHHAHIVLRQEGRRCQRQQDEQHQQRDQHAARLPAAEARQQARRGVADGSLDDGRVSMKYSSVQLIARASSPSWVAPSAGTMPHSAALMHDHDAVGHVDHLLRLRGDVDDRQAVADEVLQHFLDLALGVDVDAARRLVEDQDAALLHQPAGDDDLLLVAAAEAGDRIFLAADLDLQPLHVGLDLLDHVGEAHAERAAEAVQNGDAGVLGDAEQGEDALLLALLRQVDHAPRDRVGRMADADLLAEDSTRCRYRPR